MSVITPAIAEKFLKVNLGIPDYEALIQKDRLEFLRLFVQNHSLNIYFQNTEIAAIEVENRHVPTIPEIIQTAVSGVGGNCLPVNYFVKMLLIYLGYDVFCVAATMTGTPTANHMMTVVRFSEKELYLVDLASGNPLMDLVPLHDLPFTGPTVETFYYEFRKVSDKHYGRFQVGGSLFHGEFKGDIKEAARFEFDLTPLDYQDFLPVMNEVWKGEEVTPFYRNLFLFRCFYSQPDEDYETVQTALNNLGDPNFILVFGYNTLIGGKNIREVKKFSSYAEMLPLINKYFPKLNPENLEGAITFLEGHQQFEPN